MNRVDRAILEQWEWIPGAELLGMVAPALPPSLPGGHRAPCAFPSFAAPVLWSHTNSRCHFTTWNLLMEPLSRAGGALVLTFPTL